MAKVSLNDAQETQLREMVKDKKDNKEIRKFLNIYALNF